jgi:hypothetical protein
MATSQALILELARLRHRSPSTSAIPVDIIPKFQTHMLAHSMDHAALEPFSLWTRAKLQEVVDGLGRDVILHFGTNQIVNSE